MNIYCSSNTTFSMCGALVEGVISKKHKAGSNLMKPVSQQRLSYNRGKKKKRRKKICGELVSSIHGKTKRHPSTSSIATTPFAVSVHFLIFNFYLFNQHLQTVFLL